MYVVIREKSGALCHNGSKGYMLTTKRDAEKLASDLLNKHGVSYNNGGAYVPCEVNPLVKTERPKRVRPSRAKVQTQEQVEA